MNVGDWTKPGSYPGGTPSGPVRPPTPKPPCRWCGAPRVSFVRTRNFEGYYWECGSHGNSRGEKCKNSTSAGK